jgi:C-terminal processing protease CtpA/Prc
MRALKFIPLAAAALSTVAAAQNPSPRIYRVEPGAGTLVPGFAYSTEPRAVIGVTTSGAANNRDTLGLLVSSVRPGSPAEKAGIEEGNRIASVNGVSLRLSSADVGDYDMANVMTRRLTRELDKLHPGDEVDLRVYANGQTKAVKVKTIAPDDLYEATTPRRPDAERPTLGLRLASTGSPRDSIGVFVIGVDEAGPAAKAGIEEGSRIASINGVDVRGKHSEEDDFLIFRSNSNIGRFERELNKLKPGEDATLRVYYNGQMKTVTVKAARAGDLPRRNRSMTIIGGDNFMDLPAISANVNVDGERIGATVRRALETARIATSGAMAGAGRAVAGFGNRVSW